MSVVQSFNEWDPLREVIVGTAQGAADMAWEPALRPWTPRDPGPGLRGGGRVPQSLVDEAERQLDAFAETLARLGITVHRPEPVDHGEPYATPHWSSPGGRAGACPRDQLLVVGDEVIEAPMAQRGRWSESRAYASLKQDLLRRGGCWTAAPKATMTDALYREVGDDEIFDHARAPLLTEAEPVFDAACFTRCGQDIFWRPDLVSNQSGADWLAAHLGPEHRVHRIAFAEARPTHIDTTLVPIRPGLALINPERPCLDDGLELFRRNGWRLVEAPASVRSSSASRDVSNWISMNILMLDTHTAVVEAAETPMIELLRALGCETVPCDFDRVYPFGGGPHCCTADLRRDGRLEDWFPEQG